MKKKKLLISTSVNKTVLNANVAETFTLLENSLKNMKPIIESLKHEDNPQYVKMREQLKARVEVVEAVLDSLRGDKVALRVMSR